MKPQSAATTSVERTKDELWMDSDDKQLAAAVGRLLKATSQATEGWADVAADMGSVRNEKSCR